MVDGADEFVMKDTQQSLTKKTLSGSVTTDGFGNKTSDTILTNPDITANKLALPAISNETDRPNDTRAVGALHWRTPDNRLIAGTGSEYRILVDESSSQSLFLKTLNNSSLSGGSVVGGTIGNASNPVSIDRISKLQISPGITGTNINQVAITNASGELVTESALAKLRGGFGFNATDITIPNPSSSGAYTVVGDSLSQTLSNKTIGSVTAQSGILSVVGTGALRLPLGTDAQKPAGTAADLKGMIRYNDEQDAFEGYNELSGWSALGGGGTTDRVSQAAHGFVVGDVLWLDPGNPPTIPASYKKAKADAANTAEVVGMVSRVIDAGTFELTLSGEVSGLTGLVAGEVYFLSAATAGAMTITEPSVVGQVSLPVGVASSTTSLYVAPKRGVVVGGANLRTQIGLNGAALVSQTTNIQNVTAYTAGELSGWVYIDATTDRRFYIQVQFVKDAANAWKCAYQTTGDTPPAGFNVDVIVSGADAFVQVQMPPVAGFSSANINFALNAPAVGATLPLQIDGSLVSGPVLGSTSGVAPVLGRVGWSTSATINTTAAPNINTLINLSNTDVPLTQAGTYLLIGNIGATTGTTTTAVPTKMTGYIRDASNNVIFSGAIGYVGDSRTRGSASGCIVAIVTISTATTYRLSAQWSDDSGGGAVQALSAFFWSGESKLTAIRIA